EHTKDGNEFATAAFPFLSKVVLDPYASIKALLYKKPQILQRPALTRTYVLASFNPSHKATPSYALVSQPLSLPSQATLVAALAIVRTAFANPCGWLWILSLQASLIEATSLPYFLLDFSHAMGSSFSGIRLVVVGIRASEPQVTVKGVSFWLFLGKETDIRQKDEKQSQKRQNRARNGKA
ncbi:hypothetical protein Tco_1281583, partial [Tanacetum coccineum]